MNYKIQNPVVDSFQAFLVEGAKLTKNEEYPIIPIDFVSENLPKDILPFEKAITYHGDLSNTFICFFAPDKSFERVRRNPNKYVIFFKRTAGIIGFDFSIHTDMPIIKQKSQINDNLSLTYFYGKHGIPVIPNARCGIDKLLPEFLEALPKNSIIAVGTHGFIKEKRNRYEWLYFLNLLIDNLHPKQIVVYGTLNSQIFDDIKNKVDIVCYDSWIDKRRKEVLANEH
ncbi:MAG: DUF4417 domain-containing protein [Erysipelotrichaceae bacterium]|nr:DUF4417 domain-containing protein [Erysipelotrichaceae bacterium]